MRLNKLTLCAVAFASASLALTGCKDNNQKNNNTELTTDEVVNNYKNEFDQLMIKYNNSVKEGKDLTKEFSPNELVTIALDNFSKNNMYSIDYTIQTSKMDVKETILRKGDTYRLDYAARGKHDLFKRLYQTGNYIEFIETDDFVGEDKNNDPKRWVPEFDFYDKDDDKYNSNEYGLEDYKKYNVDDFHKNVSSIDAKSVSNYIISKDTVNEQTIETSLKSKDEYIITLDFNTYALSLYEEFLDNVVGMKKHNPTFTRAKVVYTLDKDLNLINAKVNESYTLHIMGGMIKPNVDCNYTIDYNVLTQVSIPII